MAPSEKRRRAEAPAGGHGHADALREVVSRVAGGSDRLSEAELAALSEQAGRLQALLQSRSSQLRRGREVVIKGPSPFGLLTDEFQLNAIIDRLDDVEALCLGLVCKAFNHAVQRGRARAESVLKPVGIGRHVRGLKGAELGRLLSSPARLRWAKSLGFEYDRMRTTDFLALDGELRALQMVVADGCPWGDCTTIWAAGKGHLETLRWAAEHGCPQRLPEVCEWAATIENALERGAPPPDRAALAELHQRALAVISWAMDGGARCAELSNAPTSGADGGGILERAAGSGNVPVLRWLAAHGGLREGGAEGNYRGQTLENLWTRALGAPCPCVEATVDCLRELGMPWHAAATAGAAGPDSTTLWRLRTQAERKLISTDDAKLQLKQRSNLPLLRRLREADCPWDAETCAAAARAGDLAVLQFARTGGCDWDERVVSGALSAIGTPLELPGHRETLRWALEHDCPRSDGAVQTAAELGNIEMLTLLTRHGCAVMPECLLKAACKGHLDCLKWLMLQFERDGMGAILRLDGPFGPAIGQAVWSAACDPSGGQLLHESVEDWAAGIAMTHGSGSDDCSPKLEVLHWLVEAGCARQTSATDELFSKLVATGWIKQPARDLVALEAIFKRRDEG